MTSLRPLSLTADFRPTGPRRIAGAVTLDITLDRAPFVTLAGAFPLGPASPQGDESDEGDDPPFDGGLGYR